MKKINQFLICIFLISMLTIPVPGYPGMGGNTSKVDGNLTLDPANTTQSDQNIEISSHLIELDANKYESQNKLYVRETIVFRNSGDKTFSGSLKTWIPDGVEEIKVMKAQMVAETGGLPITTVRNGNIISWQDSIEPRVLPMYVVEYVMSAEPAGTISKTRYYSKNLLYPTLINYQYIPSPGFPVFILKVTKTKESSITLLDGNRDKINAQDSFEEEGSMIYRFSDIGFRELNIEISKSAVDPSQIAIYAIIGLLIILVLAYPLIRNKSEKVREIEEKIRNSLKRDESEEELETGEEASEDEPVEEAEEKTEEAEPESEDTTGIRNEELESEKSEISAKLEELEKDYAAGKLIDEEYEELRNSYQEKLRKT